jgi:hypothetical protein
VIATPPSHFFRQRHNRRRNWRRRRRRHLSATRRRSYAQAGFGIRVYILENPSIPGVVKIGKTEREVAERARELSSATGVPTEFTVFRQYSVEDATATERKIHEQLAEHRVSNNREFFKLSADEAASIIEEMLGQDPRKFPDYNREDELYFAATQIAISLGKIEWPGILAGTLKISHEEAMRLVQGLQASSPLKKSVV